MTQPKQPPPGVETTPQGPVVSLQEAATRLGKDPRTVIRAITGGEIRGGAVPRPERLRWYVFVDALSLPITVVIAATRMIAQLRRLGHRCQVGAFGQYRQELVHAGASQIAVQGFGETFWVVVEFAQRLRHDARRSHRPILRCAV